MKKDKRVCQPGHEDYNDLRRRASDGVFVCETCGQQRSDYGETQCPGKQGKQVSQKEVTLTHPRLR